MVPTSSSNEQNEDCADWVKMVLCELMFLWVFCHPIVIQNFELATGAGEISLKRGRWDESYGGCRPHGWTESGKNNCRLLPLLLLFVLFICSIPDQNCSGSFILFKTFCSNDLSFFYYRNSQVNSDIWSAFEVWHRSIKPATLVDNLWT